MTGFRSTSVKGTVHLHGTCAEFAQFTTVLGARQPALLPQNLQQRLMRGEYHGAVFVDELPRTPLGKIRKAEMRDPYWRGRERRI